MDKLIIDIVKDEDELYDVYKLTHKCYINAGLIKFQESKLVMHNRYFDLIDETKIFIVKYNDKIIGTNSITIDTDLGMPFENYYNLQFNKIRSEGIKLAYSWRNAIDPAYKSRSILFMLFQATIEYIIKNKIDATLASFDIKHESIYKKLLNFKTIRYKKINDKLWNNESVALMRCNTYSIPDAWFDRIEFQKKYNIQLV